MTMPHGKTTAVSAPHLDAARATKNTVNSDSADTENPNVPVPTWIVPRRIADYRV